MTPTKAQQGHNPKGNTMTQPTIAFAIPSGVPVGMTQAYKRLRRSGARHNDAVRALQQAQGDRTCRDVLREQNRRGMQHSLVDIG